MARRLDPVGAFENTNDDGSIDIEPIILPIVAYTPEGKPVTTEVEFQPWQPAGAAIMHLANTPADGTMDLPLVVLYLRTTLMPGSVEKFAELVSTENTEVIVPAQTLFAAAKAILDEYAARPTPPPYASRGGGLTTPPTLRAAQRSRASTSRRSASQKRST